MGTYDIPVDEIIDSFETFLQSQEGDVSAQTIAGAWNKLAEKYKWIDKLKVVMEDRQEESTPVRNSRVPTEEDWEKVNTNCPTCSKPMTLVKTHTYTRKYECVPCRYNESITLVPKKYKASQGFSTISDGIWSTG